jgi:hypothetical protein
MMSAMDQLDTSVAHPARAAEIPDRAGVGLYAGVGRKS